jgi:hypothetical protein
MIKIKDIFAHKIFKIFKWVILILVGSFIILIIVRTFHYFDVQKTSDQIIKIHSTKLSIDDVMGKNLPVDPGEESDKTVQGIDSNFNGIRDDVELAIFKEYPNSAKTRAVLLQYALALQMETKQKVINTETVIATIQEEDRSYQCIGKALIRDDNNQKIMDKYFNDGNNLRSFVKNQQLNTVERKTYRTNFYEYIGSYSSLDNYCDIDLSKLSN